MDAVPAPQRRVVKLSGNTHLCLIRAFCFPLFTPATLGSCASTMTSKQDPVTIGIVNGIVWTAEASQPRAEAVAMSGDRITAVGSNAEIRSLAGPSARI